MQSGTLKAAGRSICELTWMTRAPSDTHGGSSRRSPPSAAGRGARGGARRLLATEGAH